VESAKWLRKSAEHGLPASQFFLGNAYFNGVGLEKNSKEAVKWYRKAAEQVGIRRPNNFLVWDMQTEMVFSRITLKHISGLT
jgi:hypothetical protein